MTIRTVHSQDDNPQVVNLLEEALERARRGELHSVALACLSDQDEAISLSVQPGRTATMLGALEVLHARVSEGDEWL